MTGPGATDMVGEVDRGFIEYVRALTPAPRVAAPGDLLAPDCALTAAAAIAVLDAQVTSRHLDFAARALRARGVGYYTIGSAGHEGNAAVADALRVDDPAFLHYRSGAFFVRRAHMHPGPDAPDPIRDVLLGVVASRDEPIAGGRHKVFGSKALYIPPQTSTIASHLHKTVGAAFAFERGKRLGLPLGLGGHGATAPGPASATAARRDAPGAPAHTMPLREDAVFVCSFGDASINHSSAVGALNTACRSAHQGMPAPVLFVCEDNGLGISVPTPPDWIADQYADRGLLRYVAGDGCDLVSAHASATAAVAYVRQTRRPALLHLRTVRLMGHAGSDVELAYRSPAAIRADLARDPLRRSAERLIRAGALTPEQVVARYEDTRARVAAAAEIAAAEPPLRDRADVIGPLAPRRPAAIRAAATAPVNPTARARFWGATDPEDDGPQPLSVHINRALGDLLAHHPDTLVFGEDVGRKGGVYGVTRGLARRAGMARVFDTVLDEQSILGLAIGAGHLGMLPIPEIQYLAYLHNALDQLRGEAATLSYFSQGQFQNPMIVRIAAYGYQKGFGGHFHNDNAIAALREIPGLVIASPSRGPDAAAMLRTLAAAARTSGQISVFLEPIALYHVRDLHEPSDGEWAAPYRADGPHIALGATRTWEPDEAGDGDPPGDETSAPADIALITFANGVYMSRRVARRLARKRGVRCRVLDLRWLAPLPVDDIVREALAAGRVLVVDETRAAGGVSEGVIAALVDAGFHGPIRRVASADAFIPLGDAARHVLVAEAEIEAAAQALAGIPRAE